VSAQPEHATVGFVLLAGLRRDDRVIEFRRIVITTPGQGFGRAAIRCVKHLAFDAFGCRRLWLDVKPDNVRARALYASEGFREDGTPSADALIIMSISRDDHALTGANWP
jgi:RimJ/RimL family protein N-acetyltransferase